MEYLCDGCVHSRESKAEGSIIFICVREGEDESEFVGVKCSCGTTVFCPLNRYVEKGKCVDFHGKEEDTQINIMVYKKKSPTKEKKASAKKPSKPKKVTNADKAK